MIATRDQAAQAILGAVLITDQALDTILDEDVRPEHFHRDRHRAVYQAMRALHETDTPVDALTLKARFDSPQSPVSAHDIDTLAGAVPDLANLRGYCRILRQEHRLEEAGRALHAATERLANRDLEGAITAVSALDQVTTTSPAPDLGDEFIAWYETDTAGIPLPFGDLNEQIGGGLQPGEVTILGGWSGHGKTFLLKDILLGAHKAGARCHEYANEMTGPRRTARLVASLTGIPEPAIRRRELTADQWSKVLTLLDRLPYATTPTPGWQVEDYCRAMRRERWDVCAIDTVTNLPCSRVDEWDRACGMLADTAEKIGTQLILLCQLNLERDKGGMQPSPTSRDLRNTGAWNQRGRVVMFIHRDQEMADGTQIRRLLSDGHVRVEKASHGQPCFTAVTFNPRWLRFEPVIGNHDWRAELAPAA